MTTDGSSERAGSSDDERYEEVEETSAAEGEPETSREVAHFRPPRTMRDVTGTPLMNFARIDTGDMLGIGKVVNDIQRSMIPDMQTWQKELLPSITAIQRDLVPEMAQWHRSVLPSMQGMIDTLLPSLVTVNSAVQVSGITGFLDIFRERHREMMRDLFPGYRAASIVGALATQGSRTADAASARVIQQLVADPIADTSALEEMTPALRLAADVASRLTSTDEELDEEQFEEVANQVAREVDEDYDPDLPPTPDEMAASKALVQLLIALRPDLSDDPQFRRRVAWVSGGGGVVVSTAMIMSYPPAFALISTLLVIVSIVKGFQNGADRLVAPGAYKKPQNPHSED
ncbi:hypothetical protein [Oerskovia rustica]|uniref:Uncharacterized protein n=1 Tax=Oerskovia rustica TaxID=2762237 RepID=A0ABR8RU07_9CELL|nr:hypothetical protein [Oerskovia rustica]MBD7951224.1 hypothetical protein [Oerskovia rustica]